MCTIVAVMKSDTKILPGGFRFYLKEKGQMGSTAIILTSERKERSYLASYSFMGQPAWIVVR